MSSAVVGDQRAGSRGFARLAARWCADAIRCTGTLSLAAALSAQEASEAPRLAADAASIWSAQQDRAASQRVERALADQRIPGASVAIDIGGTLVFDRGFGIADLEHGVAVTPATRFRTASIAKPMTAVAVLQLVEAGGIDLDAPIRTYVPAFPQKRWPVPVRLLLGHLGGVRHYSRPGEANGTRHYPTLTASLRCFAADPLVHQPGSAYRYTTYGYTLLGCAIEHASGQSYEQRLQASVWGPAGMVATCIDDERRIIPHRARGYRLAAPMGGLFGAEGAELAPALLHDTSMKIPGGGLRSTAGDLVRFGRALLAGTLLRPETRAEMWTSLETASGKRTGYGLGFGVSAVEGERAVSHSGGQAGTSCLLRILPERDVVVAVMTNLERARLGGLVRDLLRLTRRD